MEVELNEEISLNEECNRIDVDLQNGQGSANGLEAKLKLEVSVNNANRKVVTAFSKAIRFVGEVNPDDSKYNHFTLIRNKKTNKVRLVSYDSAPIDSFNKKDGSSMNNETLTSERIREIGVTEFGSKKAIRAFLQKEKMKLDIEDVKEELQTIVSEINSNDLTLNQSQSQSMQEDSEYLPPINRNASSLEQVYELENLIPSKVMDSLQSDLEVVVETDDLTTLPLCPFCLQNLRILKGNDEIMSNSSRSKIYLYLNYLIYFLITPVRNMNRKYVVCESSPVVNSYILDNFSTTAGKAMRTRPTFMRDKAICYILVLAMLASPKNQIDLEALSKEMKIGIKKLQEISRLLAFSSGGPKTVVLKMPLPAAVTASKGKRKK